MASSTRRVPPDKRSGRRLNLKVAMQASQAEVNSDDESVQVAAAELVKGLVGENSILQRSMKSDLEEEKRPPIPIATLLRQVEGDPDYGDSSDFDDDSQMAMFRKGYTLKAREIAGSGGAHGGERVDGRALLEARHEIGQVLGQLGSGSFTEVFRCTIKDTQHEVAVKVFHSKGRFKPEGAPVRFEHPNLVQMHGLLLGPPDSLVMELCSFGTLSHLLHHSLASRSGGLACLALPARAAAAVDIVVALEYLHGLQIVHRDVKPANAFFAAPVQHPVEKLPPIKLGDRGWASELGVDMTLCAGSWRYTAPEVLRRGEHSSAADVFSWAMLLYEVASGSLPFGNSAPVRVAAVIRDGQRPDTSDVQGPAHTVEALVELMRECWAEEPSERPEATYLMRAVQRIAVET